MSPPKVQVVILQYNGSEATVKCLQSLASLDYSNFDVIVIDNGSATGHLTKVKDYLSTINVSCFKFHVSRSNLGYSGGNNLGIKYALQSGADYILILNNDTTVTSDFLAKMIAVGKSNPRVGIIGPAIDEGNRTVYGGKINWLKPELSHSSLKPTAYSLQPSHYIPGSCLFIKRQVIEKIGLLYEGYFLYFEDADYCLRARRAGYGLAIVLEAIVYHEVSSSTKKLGAPTLLYYHYRNALLFNLKNGPLWAKLLLPFWSIFIIAKQLIKIALIPAHRQMSKAILKGAMDFYRGRFGPMRGSWMSGS